MDVLASSGASDDTVSFATLVSVVVSLIGMIENDLPTVLCREQNVCTEL
jgi:hypothetical protein